MAAPGRRTDASIKRLLFEEGYRFDFFQAVRLLEGIFPHRRPVGRDETPRDEVVRFRSHLSLSFPPSAIYKIAEGKNEQGPVHMTETFMGLTGLLGVLPRHYTELLMERVRAKDTTLRDFLDLFTHRLVSLFYRVWEKHHLAAGFEQAARRGQEDRVSHYLFALMGLGTKGLRRRVVAEDRSLLCYAGLISQRPRSASALEHWFTDYFEVPVAVEQLIGAWLPLGEDDLTRLGPGQTNNVLGRTAVAGTSVWDQQARFCLRLGPLTYEEFARLLPCGRAYQTLVQLTRFHAGPTLEFDVRPILMRAEVPECRLAKTDRYAPHLGWNTWLKTTEFLKDAKDVIFAGRLNVELTGTA
ncbi:MAG: type VI secretion system baseplate subunit TssG [Nitrospirales bacterium]